MADKSRVPLGPPIRLSAIPVAALGAITPADAARAVAFWRAHATVLPRLLDSAAPVQPPTPQGEIAP